jgi:hypothetical protein
MTTLEFKLKLVLLKLGLVPRPTNKRLKALFEEVDRIVIKDDGVYEGKAMSDTVLLTITERDKVTCFSKLFEIEEPKMVFNCMCLGDYAIEFYAGQKRKATIGFHHGHSIRYDKWYGDAELKHSYALAAFLNELGLAKPLEDKLELERRVEAEALAEKKPI